MTLYNQKLIETVAHIAYIAGTKQYYSGDCWEDIHQFIDWAEDFERICAKFPEDESRDYLIELENYTEQMIKEVRP